VAFLVRACLSVLLLSSCAAAQTATGGSNSSSALAADELALLSFKSSLSDPAGCLRRSPHGARRAASAARGAE
jgi:hypothetical protein